MPLETGTYISDFVASNPAHSDALSQADSHMRWIKSAILATFTGITGAVTATHTQINSAVAAVVTGTAQAIHSVGSLSAPGVTFLGSLSTGLYSAAANTMALVANGVLAATVNNDGTITFAQAIKGGTGQLGVIGEPRLWLADTLPSGNFVWLNGQAISRAGNPVLFALWGTKFGAGDGSTTFNVANFEEVVPVGKKGMGVGGTDPGLIAASGVNANIGTTGALVGEGAHTLAQAELPNVNFTNSGITLNDPGHTHTWTPSGASPEFVSNTGGGNPASGAGLSLIGAAGTNATNTTGITISNQGHAASGGSGTALNVVQPGIVCTWMTLAG